MYYFAVRLHIPVAFIEKVVFQFDEVRFLRHEGVYTSASDITSDWNIDSQNGQNTSPSNPTFIPILDSPTSTVTSLGINSELVDKGRFAPIML